LAGGVIFFALIGPGDAEYAASVAGSGVEGSVGGEGQRPDVFGFGIEVFGGLAVFDAIDFSFGGTGGVDRLAVGGEGEDFGAIGGPDYAWSSRLIYAEHAASMASGCVEGSFGSGYYAPDYGLLGGEEGVQFGGQSEAPVPA
jgi:hypothetical protein